MALLTGYSRVQSDEGEVGHIMVEHYVIIPFALVMAAGTLLAFLAFMYVVILMAGKTGVTPFFLIQVAAMAVLTSYVLMRTLQWKLSVLVVGEGGTTPFAAAMTISAFAAVAPGMFVIVLMTVIAGRPQLDAV